MFNEVRKVPKPDHKRRIKKQKDRGKITPEILAEVKERDMECVGKKLGICECEKYAWGLECHHITYRSKMGTGQPENLVMVGGPATQYGTCHYKIHNNREIRRMFEEYRDNVLLPLYRAGAS
ncbi:HNH endonuclease [Brevibacillus sp. HD1.4A]|uniref:HNH endonuclease n=1 Tax=Brevibacillus sp. HD1.4A TaxID=2738978 RepID=UPI00156AD961|nr:HNH endonuclease [Brevibacillus sp. HD1.4A]NRQ51955.1 HNH endonuclease [Brevibacillus sp. HD1.4A]